LKKIGVFMMVMFCFFVFVPTYASAACIVNDVSGKVISPDMAKECEGVREPQERIYAVPKVIAGILFLLSFIPVGYGIKQLFQKNKTHKQIVKGILLCFSPFIPIILFIIVKIFENLM